ncbi:MAG: response regulator [Pedobacter sp.]
MANKQRKVMLIDDNMIDLKVNSKLITLSGLFEEIILCQSAEEGLLYINERIHQLDEIPDFILLDIQMPDMDGFEFLESFKKFSKEVKEKCVIAILSSTLDFGDLMKAEANPNVIKLLKKPLYPKELEELLKKYFIL